MGLDSLYQVSDLLWKHREEIEDYLYQQESDLFGLDETNTLYDLTNTFFEGEAKEVNRSFALAAYTDLNTSLK